MVVQARTVQVILLCCARLACQASRLSLGGMMPLIAAELKLSTAQKASLLSAFPLGYLLSQVAGGATADRCGGKPVMTVVLLSTGVGTVVCACLQSFTIMWAAVFLFGLFQGPLFPATGVLLTRWIPSQERTSATAIVDLGNPLGAIAALSVLPVLAGLWGWRGALALAGTACLGFAAVWQTLAASGPERCWYMSQAEARELQTRGVVTGGSEHESIAKAAQKVGAWRLLTVPASWGVLLANAAFNFQRYFTYTWITTYYTDALLMPMEQVALCMLWSNLADIAFTISTGRAADGLTQKVSVVSVRRLFSSLGFMGTGAGLLLAGLSRSSLVITLSVIFSCGMQACHVAGFKSSYIELSRAHAGTLAGMGNTLASVSAFAVPWVGASVLERHGGSNEVSAWRAVFFLVFLAAAVGTVLYAALITVDAVDERLERQAARSSYPTLLPGPHWDAGSMRQRRRVKGVMLGALALALLNNSAISSEVFLGVGASQEPYALAMALL